MVAWNTTLKVVAALRDRPATCKILMFTYQRQNIESFGITLVPCQVDPVMTAYLTWAQSQPGSNHGNSHGQFYRPPTPITSNSLVSPLHLFMTISIRNTAKSQITVSGPFCLWTSTYIWFRSCVFPVDAFMVQSIWTTQKWPPWQPKHVRDMCNQILFIEMIW